MTDTTKENKPATVPEAKQAGEARDRWKWVEPTVWTERMLSALEEGVKGGKWYSLMDKVYALPNLMSAFKEVKRRKGGAGVDHQTIEKPGSREKRPLGIPTVRDRVAQAALRHVLEPNFERDFAEQSYGFRPKRGCKDALRRVNSLLKAGYQSSKR